MASFHVLHWMPDPRLHIFNGYREVIETLVWGLRALGHDTSSGVNQLRPGATHIVLGAQLMDTAALGILPDDSIIYNLEQLRGLMSAGRRMDEFHTMAERFVIWDYSMLNVDFWRTQFAPTRLCHVPIGYAPVLRRIDKAEIQDIDVLLYGAPSTSRLAVLRELCELGMSTMFFCGLYDDARDALIARAKLVVNIASNVQSSIFSIVRVSYLLANRKAVISDIAAVEADIVPAIKFTTLDQVAQCCGQYLRHPQLRLHLEDEGFRTIERRDVRGFLMAALGA